jgi:hypothetical protein
MSKYAEDQPFAALILAEQTQPLEKAINQGFINQMVYELSAASGGGTGDKCDNVCDKAYPWSQRRCLKRK